jgi:hypothetical protein
MHLEMFIEGPGMPRQRIPDALLFHDGSVGAEQGARR